MNSSDTATGEGLQASCLGCGREEVSMSTDNDARITRLMDQLAAPGITEVEAQRIEGRIVMLRAQA
jgi:hypothetical protein